MLDPAALRPEPVHTAQHSSSGRDMAVRARAASRVLQALPTSERVAMLHRVADALIANQDHILAENAADMAEATQSKTADSLLQRLGLKPAKIQVWQGVWGVERTEKCSDSSGSSNCGPGWPSCGSKGGGRASNRLRHGAQLTTLCTRCQRI